MLKYSNFKFNLLKVFQIIYHNLFFSVTGKSFEWFQFSIWEICTCRVSFFLKSLKRATHYSRTITKHGQNESFAEKIATSQNMMKTMLHTIRWSSKISRLSLLQFERRIPLSLLRRLILGSFGYDSWGFDIPKLKIAVWKRMFKNNVQIQMNSSYHLITD